MDDSGPLDPELDLAGLEFFDGLAQVKGDRAHLGVGHQPPGAQHFAQPAHLGHHVRRGHGLVKLQPAAGDLLDQFVVADVVSPGLFGLGLLLALGKGQYPDLLAKAVGQDDGAPDHLVGVTRVDAQANGQLHCLVKGDVGRAEGQFDALIDTVTQVSIYGGLGRLMLFTHSGHLSFKLPKRPALRPSFRSKRSCKLLNDAGVRLWRAG